MAATIVDVASGTAVSSGDPSITLPGTPQAGDWWVVVGLSMLTGTPSVSHSLGSVSGWTDEDSFGTALAYHSHLYSRAWQSGDSTTFSPSWTATGGTKKWAKLFAWLIRPATGESLQWVGTPNANCGNSSPSSLGAGLTGGTNPSLGDAFFIGIMNDDKQTNFGGYTHGSNALGSLIQTSSGSGSPANYTSFGSAHQVPSSGTVDDIITISIDDTGDNYGYAGGILTSVTSDQDITPDLLTQAVTSFDPTVTPGAVSFTPDLTNQLVSSFDPVVTAPPPTQDITPGLATQLATAFDPTLTTGPVNIDPGLFSQLASSFDPTITTGSVDITPGLATQLTAAFDPTITQVQSVNPDLAEQLVTALTIVVTNKTKNTSMQTLGTGLPGQGAIYSQTLQGSLGLGQEMSMEGWFYGYDWADSATRQSLVGMLDRDEEGLLVVLTDGEIAWYQDSAVTGYEAFFTGVILPENQWHHIVVTRTSVGSPQWEVIIYVNGVAVASKDDWANPVANMFSNDIFNIGNSTTYDSFWGLVSEVAVYQTALSPTQVLDHFNAGRGPLDSDAYAAEVLSDSPEGFWRLDVDGYTSSNGVDFDESGNDRTVNVRFFTGGFEASQVPFGIEPDLVNQLVTAFDPSVLLAQNIDPGLASQLVTAFDPVVTTGAVSLSPELVSQLITADDPVVTAGAVDITPELLQQLVVAFDPTLTTGAVNIAPGLANQLVSTFDPTVDPGTVDISPGLGQQLATAFDPTFDFTVNVVPDLATNLSTALDPVITTGAVDITPGLATNLATAFDPTIDVGAVVISPALAANLTTSSDPVLTTGSVEITPGLASQLVTVFDPVVSTGVSIIEADLAQQLITVFDPTFIQEQFITPDVMLNAVTTFNITITTGAVDIAPGLASQIITAFDPVITAGISFIVPDLTSNLVSSFDPTITTGPVEIAPQVAQNLVTAFDPTVAVGVINITPGLVTQLTVVFDPTVVADQSVSPDLATSIVSAYDPVIVAGQQIGPDAVDQLVSTFDPTITTGSVDIAPGLVTNLVTSFDPVVTPGTVTINATLAEQLVIAYDPISIVSAGQPPDIDGSLKVVTSTSSTTTITSTSSLTMIDTPVASTTGVTTPTSSITGAQTGSSPITTVEEA